MDILNNLSCLIILENPWGNDEIWELNLRHLAILFTKTTFISLGQSSIEEATEDMSPRPIFFAHDFIQ